MADDASGGALAAIGAGLLWFIQNIGMAFYNFGYAITHPASWLDWSNSQSLMRFIYYGASVEFFFVVLTAFLILTGIGLWKNSVMWGTVRVLEGFANTVGRFFAWAGLLMVIQQIVIVFMQRIFTRPDISIGFGIPLQFDISWFAEELKLYNALVVCLCATYTFVQGGHVRVDLIYSAISFRAKRVVDMIGSIFLMVPAAVLIWMYSWFFMWRNLINPPISASDSLERLVTAKYRGMRWSELKSALLDTAKLTVMIFSIIWGVLIYVRFLGFAELPAAFADWITSLTMSPMLILICILLAYAVLGMFMDAIGMLLLTLPVVYPAVMALNGGEAVAAADSAFGMSGTMCAIWFGILVVKMAEFCLITPPIGLNCFVVAGVRPDLSVQDVFKGVMPFFVADAVTIGLLPDIPREKFAYKGNGSIKGAYMALLSTNYRQECLDICNRMTYVDFSSNPKYMSEFTSALFLPHTDLAAFPSVTAKN